MFENFDWIHAMRTSPVMLVILACSVVTFGFAVERLIYFWKRRGKPDLLIAQALVKARNGRAEEAADALVGAAHPGGAVAAQVLENVHRSDDVIEERMQIALSEQRLLFERNLGVLGTMGNTAPLIGLLGTVWGIMRAFHDRGAGIAEALFTTAAGLVVAVPAVMLYNHFTRRTNVLLTEAENSARSLRLTLSSGETTSSERAAA